MSDDYFFNYSQRKSHHKSINTTKTNENSIYLFSVENDIYSNSKMDFEKNNHVTDGILVSTFLTIDDNHRYFR